MNSNVITISDGVFTASDGYAFTNFLPLGGAVSTSIKAKAIPPNLTGIITAVDGVKSPDLVDGVDYDTGTAIPFSEGVATGEGGYYSEATVTGLWSVTIKAI